MYGQGDPYLNDLSSCSAKFLPSRAGILCFLIARQINLDGVSILLGRPQSLPWIGAVVGRAGRVTPSALSRP